jgi:mannosyl-oligosaccharide alpha-1,2-mannosidase
VFVLVSLWYYTSSPSGSPWTPDSAKGEELWKWVQTLDQTEQTYDGIALKNIDWESRREKVRDAFIISWDGYEQYAWGMFFAIMDVRLLTTIKDLMNTTQFPRRARI